MAVSPIQHRPETAEIAPEQLSHNKLLTEEQKIGEVARQFEALLLRQILSETRKTVISSEFTDNSTAASIYQDLVTLQLANSISKSGTLGLAQMLQQQLSRQLHPASPAGDDCSPEAQPTAPSGTGVARPLSCSDDRLFQPFNLHPLTGGDHPSTPHE
jgi:Rod binding domain-containing protein